MALTEEEVRHVALLSRLQLTDEEVTAYAGQLGKILEYINQLNALDTTNVDPMITAASNGNVFRADETRPEMERSKALYSAPEQDGNFFRVPKVIE